MKVCCIDFFEAFSLQGVLNTPMQYCAYCGRKLTKKEFKYFNDISCPKPKMREEIIYDD